METEDNAVRTDAARCGVLSVVMICLIIIALRLSCVSTRGECARGHPLLFMFFGHRNTQPDLGRAPRERESTLAPTA